MPFKPFPKKSAMIPRPKGGLVDDADGDEQSPINPRKRVRAADFDADDPPPTRAAMKRPAAALKKKGRGKPSIGRALGAASNPFKKGK